MVKSVVTEMEQSETPVNLKCQVHRVCETCGRVTLFGQEPADREEDESDGFRDGGRAYPENENDLEVFLF